MLKRVIATMVAAALLLGLSACGSDEAPAGARDPDATGTGAGPTDEPSLSPGETPEAGSFAYEVWFQKGDFLFVARREAPETPRVAQTAMESLLAGPSQADGKGVTTAIPQGTELLGISIEDGLATVDLSSSFDDGGGSAAMRARLGQVVFTLTQFPTVDTVEFEIEGQPVEVFSNEGIVLDKPQARADYEEFAPPIIVTAPVSNEEVSSPVTIQGTANVFEATVSLRILDADGNEIAKGFTTATCGTGCRGDYSESVEFEVDEEQRGVIVVFEQSAEDGSPLHVVRVPVTLLP